MRKICQTAFVLPIVALVFFSCNAQPSEEGRKAVTAAIAEAGQLLPPVSWPATDTFLQGIPVYEDFSSIEPLFHRDNDTTYVINFWATWCAPCIKELPYFEQLIQDSKGRKMQVVLISLDFPRQLEGKLLPFVAERQLEGHVAALTDGRFNDWIDKVSPEWGGAIPATLVYNAERSEFLGKAVKSMDELQAAVQRVMQ
jgi:thiol-disulfide isomerase/thioredoxin